MSPVKEPNYFDRHYRKGIDWYRSYFPHSWTKYYSEKIKKEKFFTGEASAHYYWHPHAPKRAKQLVPNAKIIDARRHPLDSCLGSYKQLFARGQPFTYDLFELGEFYLEYERLMDHWNEVLPGKMLRVQYEDVVTDLEAQVRRILNYCDLPWNDACLKFYETDRAVKTASSEQVRKPIYASSMHRWRNYQEQLQPLIEVLEPLLRTLPADWHPKSLGSG